MTGNEKRYTILIVGAGQLGSRYLQGLAKCTIPLSVYVSDISPASLATAESRWLEVSGDQTPHALKLFVGLDGIPAEIDLAIIATIATVRLDVVQKIVAKATVKNWILEKVLAQSEEQIKLLGSTIGTGSKVWVNTPYRAMDWYNKIKSQMVLDGNFFCVIKGGNTFGLASNAVHYMDLLVWLSGETVDQVITGGLDHEWHKSKRPGFWDIFGTIEIIFSKGSKAIIHSTGSKKLPITIHIKTMEEEWMIHESDGIAIRNNELKITGRDEYQSEMTAPVVESILLSGTCRLPGLAESTAIHLPLIHSFLDHWNQNMPEKLTTVPIT